MHDDHEEAAGVGHNHGAASVAQWQTPHRAEGNLAQTDHQAATADLDLVEQSFVEGFGAASDTTSFLRLAGIPFSAKDDTDTTLSLLRVTIDHVADVGSITPHLGGQSYRYDPLPAKLVSKRQTLRFVYHDGAKLRSLSFAEARSLTPDDENNA